MPYADLLNHSPYAFSYFYYQSIPLSNEREVTLYADRSYAKNDQVLISYGQKSNAELLLLYGFVIDRNLFDEVDITVSLDESDPRYDEKVAFLQKQGAREAALNPVFRAMTVVTRPVPAAIVILLAASAFGWASP